MASLGPTIQEIWMRNQQMQQQQQQADARFAFEQQKHKDSMLLQAMGQDASNRQYETPEQRLKRELAVTEMKGKWGLEQRNANDTQFDERTRAMRDNTEKIVAGRERVANIGVQGRADLEQTRIDNLHDSYVRDGDGGSGSAIEKKYNALKLIGDDLRAVSQSSSQNIRKAVAASRIDFSKLALEARILLWKITSGYISPDKADEAVLAFEQKGMDALAAIGGAPRADKEPDMGLIPGVVPPVR